MTQKNKRRANAAPEGLTRTIGHARNKRALLAAALALPGLGVTPAQAGNAPQEGSIGFKILHYQDSQPSGKRMRVIAPSIHVAKTTLNDWVVQGSAVVDSVSGASPLQHSTLSGASGQGISDTRRAGDVKVTRYFERFAVGLGGAYSKENDYKSSAGHVDVRWFSPSKNTTVTVGAGVASDVIDSVNRIAINERRSTNEWLLGLTQVLTPNDIVQTNVTYASGSGYFNDPYKSFDVRPNSRSQLAWLVRWNHHFEAANATLRSTYRHYQDSWNVRGFSLGAEWVQAAGNGLSLIPSLRYASQSAASFYFDPPFPTGVGTKAHYSADQRLSSFGALTPGFKVVKDFASGWSVDFKAEYYEQRSAWRLRGTGSPGLEPFRAQIYQLGVSTKF